jgi:signal transduction histidine kinase
MQMERPKPTEDSRLRILTEISQQITSILDINEVLVQVVRLIQRTFNYYHVGIGLIEQDEVVYRVGAGVLWDDPHFQFKPQRLKVGSEGITGWVAHTGKPVLSPDITREPHYVWMQGSLTKSELTVPITIKGKTIGVLDIQSQHLDNFEQTDLEIMQAIASQTGVAIENARLFAETQRLLKETQQRAGELTIINSVQQGLASKLDVQSIYDLIGDTFHNFFNAQVVVISTYDPKTDSVEHRYAIERSARIPWPGTHPPGGFRTQIINTKQPILVNSNVAEEAARLGQPTLQGTDTPKSWLGVPVLEGDQVTGILSVQNLEEENAFTESDVRLLQTFAASMSIALENARLFSNLERRAEQFRVLTEVSQHVISLTSVNELLNGVAHLVKETFGYLHVGVGLVKDDQVVSRAEVGAFEDVYNKSSIPLGEGIWGRVAQEGTAILSSHVNGEEHHQQMHNLGIHSHLCVPLKIKDRVIGVMSAASDRTDAFDQSDKDILQTLANQVSIAIENARLYERARQLAVLEERQRLGRELHDSVTQSLYGISLYAQAATGNMNTGQMEQAQQYLEDIQSTAQESLADMRLLIYELRPPILEKEGLVSALQSRLTSVENRANIKSNIQSNLVSRLPLEMEEGMFQIAREALNNTVKHARASKILLNIQKGSDKVSMEISDDGIGFDPKTAHQQGRLGLVSMKERAQSHGWVLLIESSPGNGTKVTVEAKLS